MNARALGAGPLSPTPGATALSGTALAAYGLLGMPLAMAALPLYVHLPKFYGAHLGVSLTALGVLLLSLRLLDGLIDPLLGAWSDRARSRKHLIAIAMPLLAAGIVALFTPPVQGEGALLAWMGGSLVLVYFAFSLATINHGAWGAEWSRDPRERTRITAVRESLALLGVVVASVAPAVLGGSGGDDAGLPRFALAFAALSMVCLGVTLAFAPSVRAPPAPRTPVLRSIAAPLANRLFRALLAVFVLNGIASAIPATLVLFFIGDVLGAPSHEGALLAVYFVAGAAGMPLWVKLAGRYGKVRAWHLSMLVAVIAFVWATQLHSGEVVAFGIICAMSGLALGADLALPPSLLADVIGRDRRAQGAGAYFGLWTLVTKLNLALAAGIALPLLAALDYVPGTRDTRALTALALVYAGIPCMLKIGAAIMLASFERRSKEVAG